MPKNSLTYFMDGPFCVVSKLQGCPDSRPIFEKPKNLKMDKFSFLGFYFFKSKFVNLGLFEFIGVAIILERSSYNIISV